MKDRIYVCHTYYHAYVSFLKELALRASCRGEKNVSGLTPRTAEDPGSATLMLSLMSNKFESFPERVMTTGVFEEVIFFDEKREDHFPELNGLREDKGNLVKNLFQRIKFTKLFAKLEEPYIPVDFKAYGDIYVYCDIDPVGYYLNQKKIPYHAVEDGLNTLKNFDLAHYMNRGHFKLKAFLSKRLNLIFVNDGFGKYCKDMEVNDISVIPNPNPYFNEVPRKPMTDRLTAEDKDILLRAFVRDKERLEQELSAVEGNDNILILTDPLCTMEIREQIFKDIIAMYEPEGRVFLKPHPRDYLDYRTLFSEVPQFDATVPMELLGFFPGVHFKKVVGVLTEMKGIEYADEAIRLGPDFMDKYEDPAIHRQNEQIY